MTRPPEHRSEALRALVNKQAEDEALWTERVVVELNELGLYATASDVRAGRITSAAGLQIAVRVVVALDQSPNEPPQPREAA